MISKFAGPYVFLSNFYPAPIPCADTFAATVEHAFQAYKTGDRAQQAYVLAAPTPSEAKRRGRAVTLRPDWEAVKLQVMRFCLDYKFLAQTELAEKLLATGDEWLLEGNTWGDTFWGVDAQRNYSGDNWLGLLLMARRAELRGGAA